MARMSEATVLRLRAAVADEVIVARYWSHIRIPATRGCWVWTGAISGRGHGRFQIADDYRPTGSGRPARKTFVVIAHRFGFALSYGVDALLDVPIVAHRCDNPLCQRPACWRESNHRANGQEYARRRSEVRGSLADHRGARGRARAIRDAAKAGVDLDAAVLAGWLPVHRDQHELFDLAADDAQ
jgi:hypothetical protein